MEKQVYVTVTIPITLEFDAEPDTSELRRAAIENFMRHPALQNREDLNEYTHRIGTDRSRSKERTRRERMRFADQNLKAALGHLIQWAVGNRGSKDSNPYSVPEIKAALKTLAEAKGWTAERIKSSYYDAADEYQRIHEVAQRLKGAAS